MCLAPSGSHRPNTIARVSRWRRRDRCHARRGGVPVKGLIAVAAFLVIAVIVKLVFRAAPDIAVLESRRVSLSHLGGGPVDLERLRAIISTGESAPRPGAGSRMVHFQKDPPGDLLLVRLRLSREFLESHGKIHSGTATIATKDILLQGGGGGTSPEPVFLLSCRRDEIETKKGKATQFSFSGITYVTHDKVSETPWLAVGQIKATQEMTGTLDLTCLYGPPAESGDLQIRVLDVSTIALK